MDNGNIHTPIGMFDINKLGEGFICKEDIGVSFGNEVIIKSCYTKVIVTNDDGTEQIIEPIVTESCMKPGTKVVIPITYKAKDDGTGRTVITLSNHYNEIVVDSYIDEHNVRTEYFEPVLKKKSCAECENCGRC